MKTRLSYLLLLVVFLAATVFVISKYYLNKEKTSVRYALQPRQGILANSPEWTTTKQLAYRLNKILQSDAGNTKAALQLVTLFIREARVTGNYMYYDAAALKYLKNILTKEPKNVEALVLESVIYLSQHHFAEGLEIAERARQLNPHFAFTYGLLVDGNVEMGNYKTAVENSDQMVSIRPDLRSYSRISYLREIYGDDTGAIEAMKMAVEAGQNGDESTEWSRVQLAKLYENRGDLKSAEMYYTIALDNRPGYVPAIAGLGHIAIGYHDYTKAIHLYQQAALLWSDYSIHYQLASLYFLVGEKEKAAAIVKKSIIEMTNDAVKGEQDENIGHYADRELSYAYLFTGDYDNALAHALKEYNRRPQNIDVNETVAWVYHKQGKNEEALPYIKAALNTNSKNPTLLCRAGLIFVGCGNKTGAKTILQQALQMNPNIDVELKKESDEVLKLI